MQYKFQRLASTASLQNSYCTGFQTDKSYISGTIFKRSAIVIRQTPTNNVFFRKTCVTILYLYVDVHYLQIEICKTLLHNPLKCSRRIAQALREPIVFVEPQGTNREGCSLLMMLGNFDLMITRLQIKSAEVPSATHGV